MFDNEVSAAKEHERKAWERQMQTGQNAQWDKGQADAPPRNIRTPRGTPIRHRIERALMDADGAVRRGEAARRALSILEQHPEFAELLDLLNEF